MMRTSHSLCEKASLISCLRPGLWKEAQRLDRLSEMIHRNRLEGLFPKSCSASKDVWEPPDPSGLAFSSPLGAGSAYQMLRADPLPRAGTGRNTGLPNPRSFPAIISWESQVPKGKHVACLCVCSKQPSGRGEPNHSLHSFSGWNL